MEWSIQSHAKEKSIKLAECLGCNESDSKKTLAFLRNIKDLPILFGQYFNTLSPDEKRRGLPIVFKPTIEVDTVNVILFHHLFFVNNRK